MYHTCDKYAILAILFWSLIFGGFLALYWTEPDRHECNLCVADFQLPQCHMSYCSVYN
jgi:hypothetical protein